MSIFLTSIDEYNDQNRIKDFQFEGNSTDKKKVENGKRLLGTFLFIDSSSLSRILTKPCGRQSHDHRHRDFALGCSRSTRGRRRTWPRWDSRLDFFVLSRTGRCRDPYSNRSQNRRTSAERFAVFPPEGSHLFRGSLFRIGGEKAR